MRVYLSRGFKCYVATAESGRLWGFVALKPEHPYHGKAPSETPIRGLSWTSTAENLNRVQIPDKPSGKIGSRGDWIMGIDSEVSEERMIEALDCLTAMLSQAAKNRPPSFMVAEFRSAVMPELVSIDDSPERRREAWRAFVEMCVGNKVISEKQARSMGYPMGLTRWESSEFF